MPKTEVDQSRPEYDECVIEALKDGRHADDIRIIQCPWCAWWSYYNEGSHASCRNPDCGKDLTHLIDEDNNESITLDDYWSDAPYPGDAP